MSSQFQVFADRQAFEPGWLLPGEGNAAFRPIRDGQGGDVLAPEDDFPGRRGKTGQAHDDRGQGGLAGAVRTKDGVNLPGENVQIEIVKDRSASDGQPDVD